MKFNTLSLALIGALSLGVTGAVAQDAPADTSATSNNTSASKMSELKPKDKSFAMKAAGGNLAEVKLGEMAASKGGSDEVKSFGQSMVTDHGKANTDLEAVFTKKGMKFEPKLNAEQKATSDKLGKLEGGAFDKAYTAAMLKDHMKDVAEYKEEVKTIKDDDLKAYATATLPVIEHHYEMLKGMKKDDARKGDHAEMKKEG